MKRAAAAFAALVLAAGLAGPAHAASERSRALAHRYIVALDMKKSFAPMLDNMLSVMTEQRLAGADLTPEQKTQAAKAIRDAFAQSMEAGMLDRMMGQLEPLLAETFTEEELQATVDFYESPVGRSMLAKMPDFGLKSGQAMARIMPEMQADLEQRIRANLAALKLEGK